MARIDADKNYETTRFSYISAGDGNEYRVARGGFGPRGESMEVAMETFSDCGKNNDRKGCYAAVRSLFLLAMEPFYNKERIEKLLDEEQFGWPEYHALVGIVRGDDLVDLQKKSSSVES